VPLNCTILLSLWNAESGNLYHLASAPNKYVVDTAGVLDLLAAEAAGARPSSDAVNT
jgi:hypothetical protein